MKAKPERNAEQGGSDRKTSASARKFVLYEGRRYTLTKGRGGVWRCRSRSKSHPFDSGLGTTDYTAARQIAVQMLEGQKERIVKRSAETLEDVAAVYLDLPKKCSDRVAKLNVSRLRVICRKVFSAELSKLRLSDVSPKLWREYWRICHGGKLDLSTRRRENIAHNAAVRMAASIFIDRLRPAYEEAGVKMPPGLTAVDWLPVLRSPPPPAEDSKLVKAWRKLPRSALWLAIGLARFAGLRRSEIEAATGEWIIERDGQAFVDLRDREGEFLTKTGRHYRAVVIDSELARALLAVPKANPIVEPPVIDRHRWFERDLAAWCKPFTGTAKKPLHRLRGLYADDVAKLTEDAVLARLEGIKEASRALGHTTTKTTLNHYLSTTPTPRMQEP